MEPRRRKAAAAVVTIEDSQRSVPVASVNKPHGVVCVGPIKRASHAGADASRICPKLPSAPVLRPRAADRRLSAELPSLHVGPGGSGRDDGFWWEGAPHVRALPHDHPRQYGGFLSCIRSGFLSDRITRF